MIYQIFDFEISFQNNRNKQCLYEIDVFGYFGWWIFAADSWRYLVNIAGVSSHILKIRLWSDENLGHEPPN